MTGSEAPGGWDAGRAVQTVVDVNGRKWFGTGYLVSAELVLTAEHVLHGARSAGVRFVDAPGRVREVAATVTFADVAADVAVLQLARAEPPVPAVLFGYPAGPVSCDAVGFPRFKLNDDHRAAASMASGELRQGQYRDSHHAEGRCRPDSNQYAGTLELTVPPPDRDPDPDHSPWEGMSGAAVFAEGLLIAVVAEHHRREGLGRLTATAVRQWPHLMPETSWHRLRQLLGLPDPAALPAVGVPAAPVSASVVRALPRDVPVFIGRTAELDRLEAVLDGAGGGVLAVHAVDGMAGIGKSVFAVHAAHRLADRFPDGQMFLPLHGHTPGRQPLSVDAALDALLAADGLSPAELPGGLEGKQLLWRKRTAGRRMLLVLDDAAGAGQVVPLLPDDPHTLVLVTSRRRLTGLDGAVPISLNLLDPQQAGELLARAAGRPNLDAADPDLQVLASLCGHLPLALALTGALLAHHPTWTPADLAADFHLAGSRLAVLDGVDRAVATALDLSCRDLTPDQLHLLTLLGAHPGTEYETGAAAALLDTGPAVARQLLANLEEHRLLTETAVRHRYRMHDLTREHAATLAAALGADTTTPALDRLYGYYHNQAGAVGTTDPAARPDHERPLHWVRVERDNILACINQADRHLHTRHVFALTTTIAPALQADGPWIQAIALHARAAALAQEAADIPALATALANLGRVQQLDGQYADAIDNDTRAMELFEELGDSLGQADALNNRASVRRQIGDYAQAAADNERALELFEQLGDLHGQAQARNNLGGIRYLTGDYAQAAADNQRAIVLYQLLGNRQGQASSLSDLGSVQYMTGDYAQAAVDHQRALELFEELGDRHGQAGVLNNLGSVRRLTGDYAQAARDHQRALELFEELGDRHGQAGALNNLGMIRCETGDYAQAVVDLQRALELYQQLGHRRGQAGAFNALGSVRYLTGDCAQAVVDHQRALELYQQLGDRYGQADALNSLGSVRRRTGDYAQAAVDHQRALELFEELGDQYGQANALNSLGSVRHCTGDYAQSAADHQRALELYQQLGYMAGQANALDGLGECLRRQGLIGRAAVLLRQALEIYQALGMVPYVENVERRLAKLDLKNADSRN